MEFISFKIENFKGIKSIDFPLEIQPNSNIFTLVGLNESGKTTILEALDVFNNGNSEISPFKTINNNNLDYDSLVPIDKKYNFNGNILIEAELRLSEQDNELINGYAFKETKFRAIKPKERLKFWKEISFKNSKFVEEKFYWEGLCGIKSDYSNREYIEIDRSNFEEDHDKLADYCTTLIPTILYFPSFLFDFPSKICISSNRPLNEKEKPYLDLIQDILHYVDSVNKSSVDKIPNNQRVNNNTNVKLHICDRIKEIITISNSLRKKPNNEQLSKSLKSIEDILKSLLVKMSSHVTEIIFEGWKRLFNNNFDAEINISYSYEKEDIYLHFEINQKGNNFKINERSVGFRWFITFLLFTQFRTHRKNTPKNIIFLFDEPASNLHSAALQQLLICFEKIAFGGECKIIYSTHNHYLINPNWLETTFIVSNNLEDHQFNISMLLYRLFVDQYPYRTSYFQPILDAIKFEPGNMIKQQNVALLEGKNDFYTLTYLYFILDCTSEIGFLPGSGANSLSPLISSYSGSAKKFIVLLDSDPHGLKAKKKYESEFGNLIKDKIYTYNDVNSYWNNFSMESLFEDSDKIDFPPGSTKKEIDEIKNQFNRKIQENLSKKIRISYSERTKNNFSKLIKFLVDKLNELN